MGFRLSDSRLLKVKHFTFIAGNPLRQHPAVTVVDVRWLNECMNNRPDLSFTDAVASSKQRLFPENYKRCEWVKGKMSF